jgi:hypothetical protein
MLLPVRWWGRRLVAGSGMTGRLSSMKKQGTGSRNLGQRMNGDANLLGSNSEIARKLKQYYDELVSDDVPDRFKRLLAQLEQADPPHGQD